LPSACGKGSKRGLTRAPAFLASASGSFIRRWYVGIKSCLGLFQFCLELLAFAQSDQVVSVLMAGDDHPGSERAEASLGTYVSWTHRKYFRSAFQVNTRPGKERELADFAGNHLLLAPCTLGTRAPGVSPTGKALATSVKSLRLKTKNSKRSSLASF